MPRSSGGRRRLASFRRYGPLPAPQRTGLVMLRPIGIVVAAALVVAACQSSASLAPTSPGSPTPPAASLAAAPSASPPPIVQSPAPSASGPAPSGCVNPPPDLATIVALDPAARLACFGGSSLTFAAIVSKAISDCGVGPRVEPGWFCLPGVFLAVPNPSAIADLPPLDVYWNPTSGLKPATFVAGASVKVTGHFDDPAASTCHITEVPSGQSPPAPDQVVLACRETFIVSAVSGGG
jgi:hypothetical protein